MDKSNNDINDALEKGFWLFLIIIIFLGLLGAYVYKNGIIIPYNTCQELGDNYSPNLNIKTKEGYIACCKDIYENNLKVDTECVGVKKDG